MKGAQSRMNPATISVSSPTRAAFRVESQRNVVRNARTSTDDFLYTENPYIAVEVFKRKCIMVNTNKGGEEIPQGELRFNTRNVLGV